VPGCSYVVLSAGAADCVVTGLLLGGHSFSVSYGGSAAYNNAYSATLPFAVQIDPVVPTNVAQAVARATASASSVYSAAYPASAAINGDRAGLNWGNGSGWNDGTASTYPDWLQVDFFGTQTINKVIVYTLQDNVTSPVEPTDSMTFTSYGVVDFTVQGWNGSAWVTLGGVTNNNLVKRAVDFAAFSTSRIRINVTRALGGYSHITEVEAYTPGAIAAAQGSANVALASGGREARLVELRLQELGRRLRDARAILHALARELRGEAIGDLQVRLRPRLGGIRLVRPEGIHLTLRFLGETSPAQVETLRPRLATAAALCPLAEARVAGLGTFPERGSPRVLWLGLEVPPPVLDLQRACERAARAAGFEGEDRPFRAHLTLGRWRERAVRPDLPPAELGATRLDALVLFRSDLHPGGAVYTPLARFPLGGSAVD